MTVTKEDIQASENRIIDRLGQLNERFDEKMDLTLKPLNDTLSKHQVAIHGKSGREGLVGDVNQFKGTIKTLRGFKWTSVAALLAAAGKIAGDLYGSK